MKRGIYIIMFAALLLAAACNAPHGERQSSKTSVPDSLLAYISQRVNYYKAPDSVLGICYEYLPKVELLSDSLLLCKGIGTALNIKGKYDEANRYLYDALRMAEQLDKDSLQCMILSELGILQFHLGNADESINMYMQALAFAQKAKDSTSIAVCTNNIGNAYMTVKKDFQSAIPYFEQCFEIGQKIGYSEAAKVAGINLAMIYNELGEPDKAMREVQKVIDSYAPDIYSDYTFAQAYQLKGNYREAIRRFQDILKKPLNTREFELAILKNMADVYKASGNLDSTVVYLEKSYALRDSLHNQQSDETIHNLKIAYETEKKETQIAALEDEKRLMIWFGIAGGAVLLLALTAFFFLWRWTVQKKRLAESQIKQLEQEKQLIATQALLDGEVQERTRLARDLHDGLGSMLTGARMSIESLKNDALRGKTDMADFDSALKILNDSSHELRRIAHNLMPDTLSRFGLKTSVGDFCDALSAVKFLWYGDETRLNPKTEEMIYRTVHELVNNALKHARASQILVQIIQEPNRLAFTVQDDGDGFDPETVTEGMGLQNIRTRVASFGGIMNIASKAGEGTEINVELRIEN